MGPRTSDFEYHLPEDLIAQEPPPRRGDSRLLVVHRDTGTLEHRHFSDLPVYIRPGDLLIANRSRVRPARLLARKESGGRVELLLLRPLGADRWSALARPSRRLHMGTTLRFDESSLEATLGSPDGAGQWEVRFTGPVDSDTELRRLGTVPLPPYIRASPPDPERYQTVYADREGSVAAPTAGLHFSSEMLMTVRAKGAGVAYVTLHVGPGTFRPVKVDQVEDHHMHSEWGEVPQDVARAHNATRAAGGRIIAIGTTSTRILESAYRDQRLEPFRGETDIFIYPGYRFRAIDALLTNFHLPRSTLLMLVSALAGRDLILRAYREAVERRYRFFSFGDAMLIV